MTDKKVIQQHEAMDTILRFLIDNKSDQAIHSENIWKKVFPDQKEEVVYFLLKQIMATGDSLVVTHIRSEDIDNFEVFFEANAITERFLNNQGGFTGQFEREQAVIKEQERIDALNKQTLESEVDIINFQKGLGKKLTIWGFVIAVVSVLASILTTIISNNQTSTETIRIDSLEKQVKAIQTSINSFENKKQLDTTHRPKLEKRIK